MEVFETEVVTCEAAIAGVAKRLLEILSVDIFGGLREGGYGGGLRGGFGAVATRAERAERDGGRETSRNANAVRRSGSARIYHKAQCI